MSDYLNEIGRRIPILGRISINENVEYLGVTDFHRTGGPFWAINILSPCSIRGYFGTPPIITGKLNLWDLMEVLPSRGFVSSLSIRLTSPGPENMRATTRRVRDD